MPQFTYNCVEVRIMNLSQILKKYSKKNGKKKLIYVWLLNSPIGKIVAGADQEYLQFVAFLDSKNIEKIIHTVADTRLGEFVQEKNKILETFENEMKQYFDGILTKFSVPIITFGSAFQREVWEHLVEIPYGTTQTYGSLANRMGRASNHSRAVGAACGANAHVIIIPCHRLVAVGSNGGFSCGTSRKDWLIQHENKFAS